jgi:hypothetical protein
MNTQEIRHALVGNYLTAKIARGVFARDQVPAQLGPYPAAFIVNTDVVKEPGTHWVAVYQGKEDEVEFFDSFGRTLSHYKLDFLAANKRLVLQNDVCQSALSTVCGQYCLFFLLRRAGGESFSHILHLFTDSRSSNDTMVCQYINFHFRLDTVVYDHSMLKQAVRRLS